MAEKINLASAEPVVRIHVFELGRARAEVRCSRFDARFALFQRDPGCVAFSFGDPMKIGYTFDVQPRFTASISLSF